jgi:hypothetical protein
MPHPAPRAALFGAGVLAGLLALAPARAEGLRPPPPPPVERTLQVCQDAKQPECHPTIEAALAAVPGGGLRIRVHCGSYQGGSVDLRRRSDIWIEGIPCPDGQLPRIDLPAKPDDYWLRQRREEGDPPPRHLRVERLEIVGERKAVFRLEGAGPVVFSEIEVRESGNGVQVSSIASGDYWVVDSTFEMNGLGEAGLNHHVYASCEAPDCRLFVLDSRFGGLHSHAHRNCSNQVRIRAREAIIAGSVFDARAGCVSRLINASDENRRLRIVDSVLIQGPTENPQMVNTPPIEDAGPVLEIERVVAVSLRPAVGALVGYKGKPQVTLRDVLFVRPGGCAGGYGKSCLFDDPSLTYLNPTTIEATRVSRRLEDLPEEVRALLAGR